MPAALIDYDGTFFRGAKSDSDPGQLPLGYYFAGLNVINQGGVLSTRPGYRCIYTLPEGNLQGGIVFRPKIGLESLVVAVEGRLFAAEYPFTNFKQIPNVQFAPEAKQLFFCLTEQSAERNSTELESSITTIPPRVMLIIQDGGITAPAYYDGSQAAHIRDFPFETPSGSSMQWVGDRLWVAVGAEVRASDISNPLSFREELYLGGEQSFVFDSEVTAMATTPSLEFPQLLVFTDRNTSIIQANIRTRTQWESTPNMQQEVFRVGCISQRSVVAHYGQLMWMSPSGVVFFDSAALSKQTARLPIRDNEMAESKIYLSKDLSLSAGGAYGQYLLMSVPAHDRYNQHTWVLNNSSLETLTDESGPSWCGIWTGTRPVEWFFGVIAGSERCYYISKDHSGENRLWEAFTPDRLDDGCPILSATSLRGHFGQTTQAQKITGSDCRFRYAQLAFTAIEEGLDLGVFFAGGLRGAYKQILNRYIEVQRGSISYDSMIDATQEMMAFKAQSRRVRTQDVNDMLLTETGSCPVESLVAENEDECFQILIVWHGPATLRWVRTFADPVPDSETGDPATACGRETEFKVVRFDGVAVNADDMAEAIVALSSTPSEYVSNQSASVTVNGISSTGIGESRSIVSQAAADRVATKIAERLAEIDVMAQLPSTLSAGLE